MPWSTKNLAILLMLLIGLSWLTACRTLSPPPDAQDGGGEDAASAGRDGQDVLKTRLDNGLQVILVKSDLAPVVTTRMTYHVGSADSPPDFSGMAHAHEHMMFRGSPGLSNRQLAVITARLGADVNAFTNQDMTQFQFTVPRNDLNLALRIEAIRMRAIDATPQGWRDEREAIYQELSGALSSPQEDLMARLSETLFAGTPYADTVLGTRESLVKTQAAQIRQFHRDWYAPNNASLVISGDLDLQRTLEDVKALFGDIPARRLPARPDFDFQPVADHPIQVANSAPYGMVYRVWRIPGLESDEAVTASILFDALNSQRGQLAAMAYDGRAQEAGVFSHQLTNSGMALAFALYSAEDDPAPLRRDLEAVTRRAANQGVPADLVVAAKRQAIASVEAQRESVGGLADVWTAAVVERGLDSPTDLISRIEAVTPAQVNALAARLLDPSRAVTATLVPQTEAGAESVSVTPEASSLEGRQDAFTTAPQASVELPEWAQRGLDRLDVPVSTLEPVDMRLPNGLRLIVQPMHASRRVRLIGAVDTNPHMQQGTGEEGAAVLLEGLYDYGSQARDRLALQRALDDMGARESAGTNFSLTVPQESFEQGVALLAEHQLHPNFSSPDFARLKAREASSLEGYQGSPDFRFSQALDRALLPPGDPALRHATPASIERLTPAAVRDYFERAFRPDRTTIVLVGDISAQRARDVIMRHFGGWQAQGDASDLDYPAVPLNDASRFSIEDPYVSQASATLAQMLDIGRDNVDRYALELGNQVLSGDFASRLWRELRTREGLVYEIGSTFTFDENRSRFEVSYGADPSRVDRANALIVRNIERLQRQPISSDELLRAKSKLLRAMPLSEASYEQIAWKLLVLALEDQPLNASALAAKQFSDLDAADVQKAWQRYVHPEALVTGVKGPVD